LFGPQKQYSILISTKGNSYATYSLDLRERAISYIESGGSRISASKLFCIGERTVRRWIELQKQTNSLKPRAHGGGYPPKINLDELKEYVISSPDKTLAELGKKFSVSATSIWHALKKINYVYKKKLFYIKSVAMKKGKVTQDK
jgi:transposase